MIQPPIQPQVLAPPPPPPRSMVRICNYLFYIAFLIVEGCFIGCFCLMKYPEIVYGDVDSKSWYIWDQKAVNHDRSFTNGWSTYSDYYDFYPIFSTSMMFDGDPTLFVGAYYQGIEYYGQLPEIHPVGSFQYHLEANWYILSDITVWVLVGYGFLMSYLRFHRWMSLGMTFFIIALTVQAYVLFSSFWYCAWWTNYTQRIYIDLRDIISGLKCSVAVLITYGALAGKVDIFEILNIILLETCLYSLNEWIVLQSMMMKDIGGATYIHVFGAFYGLGATWVYSPKSNCYQNPNNRASYGSNTLTFLGTFFLWIYFPAFNCFNQIEMYRYHYMTNEAGTLGATNFQHILFNLRMISLINTMWALTASVACAFFLSMLLNNGKFIAEHILNATLAGGVMIANCAHLYTFPFPSLIIGAWAGLWSVLAFQFLPRVFAACNIFDTRGVMFLHGIPGIWGNIASAITCATLADWTKFIGGPDTTNMIIPGSAGGFTLQQDIHTMNMFVYYREFSRQGGFQILGLIITIGIALVGGLIQGVVLRFWRCYNVPEDTFGDHCFFKMIQEDALRGINEKPIEPIVSSINPPFLQPVMQPPIQ